MEDYKFETVFGIKLYFFENTVCVKLILKLNMSLWYYIDFYSKYWIKNILYFSSFSKLTVHARMHTGECRYECSYCSLKVSTRSHLVAHERIHTGEKPYTCEFCSKVCKLFMFLGNFDYLPRHIKIFCIIVIL